MILRNISTLESWRFVFAFFTRVRFIGLYTIMKTANTIDHQRNNCPENIHQECLLLFYELKESAEN